MVVLETGGKKRDRVKKADEKNTFHQTLLNLQETIQESFEKYPHFETFEFLLEFGYSSFLRKQESISFKAFWIPAFAGMTKLGAFFKGLTLSFTRRRELGDRFQICPPRRKRSSPSTGKRTQQNAEFKDLIPKRSLTDPQRVLYFFSCGV